MIIKSAVFLKSSTKLSECPNPIIPEYAFTGRSNVGKSSLINMLTGNGKLAKISSTPGKTRLINHFLINDEWYLVDLPGFGFAKTSKKDRQAWKVMINTYIKERNNLLNTFILVDSRLKPQKTDMDLIRGLGLNNIPFSIVFTKIDKLTKNQFNINMSNYHKALLEEWECLPNMFYTSSTTNIGKDDVLNFISNTNKIFKT